MDTCQLFRILPEEGMCNNDHIGRGRPMQVLVRYIFYNLRDQRIGILKACEGLQGIGAGTELNVLSVPCEAQVNRPERISHIPYHDVFLLALYAERGDPPGSNRPVIA